MVATLVRVVHLPCLCAAIACGTAPVAAGQLAAFPGATGQGAASTGGRGGDVYHVTNLLDYNSQKNETKIPGSLRHAIRSAEGPRTIVFDVGGAIALASPLEILKDNLTIAGQTAPGGVTLWGYPVEISQASDVVVRYLRIRPGDFHAAGIEDKPGRGNQDLAANHANALQIGNRARRIIVDHLSVSWSMDETLSVSNAYDVTVQNCLIAESLNESFHPKGKHGYGSLIRATLSRDLQQQGTGGYTFYGNLWAHHRARNPSIAGQQSLRPGQTEADRGGADVNLVNNVVYNWGERATHRSTSGQIRVNLVGNCYLAGKSSQEALLFNNDNPGQTLLYCEGNWLDKNRNSQFDQAETTDDQRLDDLVKGFDKQGVLAGPDAASPFPFYQSVRSAVCPAAAAFDYVSHGVGASLPRDAVDQRIVDSVTTGTGSLIDSQETFRGPDGVLPGIDDLPTQRRPAGFDTDGDGMPNDFEAANHLDPDDPSDGPRRQLCDGTYNNLEIYLNSLTGDSVCTKSAETPDRQPPVAEETTSQP